MPPPPVHPTSLQPKAAPSFPGVVQPASKRKREEEVEDEQKVRRSKRRKKERPVQDEEEMDRLIALQEQRDQESFEKKRQENLKKYESRLSLTPPTQGSQQIKYLKGRNSRQRVNSLPISKDLMSKAYGEAMTGTLEPTFFHITAPTEEKTLTQHYVVRRGHDYVLFPLAPTTKENEYKQEGKDGPAFVDLAINADAAAQWLLETQKETYGTLKKARARVARDINRMAGGKRPRISYPIKYLAGADGLTTFAAVIRADKGRVSKATRYIESILKDGGSDFGTRFGGKKPTYIGTGQGTGRGPEGLRKKGKEDPGEDSEYSGDEM